MVEAKARKDGTKSNSNEDQDSESTFPSEESTTTTFAASSEYDASSSDACTTTPGATTTRVVDRHSSSSVDPAAAAGASRGGDNNNVSSASTTTSHAPRPPGAYAVYGPGFRDLEESAADGTTVANAGGTSNNDDDDEELIFEGYVPEPTSIELMQRRVQDMIESAITLNESAVRKIDTDDIPQPSRTVDMEEGEVEEQASSTSKQMHRYLKPFTVCVFLTLLLAGGVTLGVTLGRSGNNDVTPPSDADDPLFDETNNHGGHESTYYNSHPSSNASCINTFPDRYDHAVHLVSRITSAETIADASSPQRRSLEWIVCDDGISSDLIDRRDPLTGALPKQGHGTEGGNDSGEAQVLRRYALAAFFFATQRRERRGWNERWNFLSPDAHECGWHENKTRQNFHFGEFDPAGFVCLEPEVLGDWGNARIVLDDGAGEIGKMHLNFRIPNNLTGTMPLEIGFLDGLTNINLENQEGLHGSIPTTIGNLVNLHAISILLTGPGFGGVIPSSLFKLPSLQYIHWMHNEGTWEFPSSVMVAPNNIISGMSMKQTGLSGTVPAFMSQLTSLTSLDLSDNDLEGTIPEAFGNMSSLVYLNMYNNNLNGTLSQSLGWLTSLDAMVLGRNKFEGSLPTWLGNFSKLRLLDLSNNNFEGTVPATISRLSSLEHISLQRNFHLNGSISAFEPLGSLSSLLLYENSFSSTIPAGLFSDHMKPIYADFGHNYFTGTLPPIFSERASNTSYLAIMQNDFDANVVNDVICEEVPVLFADCSSCPCCDFCCTESSTDEDNRYCNFDLDLHKLVGLECGHWWYGCYDNYFGAYYDPLPLN